MQIFTLVHQISEEKGIDSVEIIDVYQDSVQAIKAFNFYLDTLESVWRNETPDRAADKTNTFNRFSEISGNFLSSAICLRDNQHNIWVNINHLV